MITVTVATIWKAGNVDEALSANCHEPAERGSAQPSGKEEEEEESGLIKDLRKTEVPPHLSSKL